MNAAIVPSASMGANLDPFKRILHRQSLESWKQAVIAAHLLEFRRGKDVKVFDVQKPSGVTDYFVVATGLGRKHLQAMADAIVEHFSMGAVEGSRESNWIIVDLGGCIVQLFSRELREYYGVDLQWKQVPDKRWKDVRPQSGRQHGE